MGWVAHEEDELWKSNNTNTTTCSTHNNRMHNTHNDTHTTHNIIYVKYTHIKCYISDKNEGPVFKNKSIGDFNHLSKKTQKNPISEAKN